MGKKKEKRKKHHQLKLTYKDKNHYPKDIRPGPVKWPLIVQETAWHGGKNIVPSSERWALLSSCSHYPPAGFLWRSAVNLSLRGISGGYRRHCVRPESRLLHEM